MCRRFTALCVGVAQLCVLEVQNFVCRKYTTLCVGGSELCV